MIKKWKTMSPADKLRMQLLIGFSVVGLYMPLYLMSSKRVFEAERMLSRRKDRMEKRADISKVGNDGLNSRTVSNNIKKADKEIVELQNLLKQSKKKFVPLNAVDEQQVLRLEFSTMAEDSGVQLISLARRGSNVKATQKHEYLDRETGRPVLQIEAHAAYGELLSFLQRFSELSFYVSVMNVKVYVNKPDFFKQSESAADNKLYVYMEVSI